MHESWAKEKFHSSSKCSSRVKQSRPRSFGKMAISHCRKVGIRCCQWHWKLDSKGFITVSKYTLLCLLSVPVAQKIQLIFQLWISPILKQNYISSWCYLHLFWFKFTQISPLMFIYRDLSHLVPLEFKI